MSQDYPPYEYVDANGEAAGFTVDLIRAAGKAVGFDVQLRTGTWKFLLAELRAGRVDVLPAMLQSDARAEWVAFSTPLLNVEYSIFVRKGTRGITTLEELRGHPTLVEAGSLMHEFLVKNGMEEQAITVTSEPEALRILDQGQFVAALVPYRQGLVIAEKSGLMGVEPAGPPITSSPLSFAVVLDDPELIEALNAGLKQVRASGRFQEIYNDHFGVTAITVKGESAWSWRSVAAALFLLGVAAAGVLVWQRISRREGDTRMLGSYELLSKIGAGGMGEVWHARHVALERSAAIKLIRVEALQGSRESAEHALVRFEREARATAALRSPHTVELYDYGQAPDGSVYYAMELLEGLDLQSLVERHGPLPPERAVHLLQQICSSLEEAHRQGLLHRDIKPANIFACHLGTAFDVVKVLDFGLVKLRGIQAQQSVAITRADAVTGTPLCLAPEIVMGEIEPDQRSDLYSIGCVAYWLLAGKPVFAADTPVAMAVAHATETPIPLAERNVDSKCSPELEAVVLSCLAKDPADRPESAAELASRLVACPVRDTWTPERAEAWWLEHAPELASSSSHSASSILSKSR